MTWNSNSRQSPLVLTDLQSVRWGPRDASVNVAVRNASRKLSWEELSKFTPNSPVLGVKMRIICPSQLQPAVREAIRVPHDATAERHVRGIIALWFNFSRYYRQCVRVSGLERKWHQKGCAFFSAKEFERTHTEAPPPLLHEGLLERWVMVSCSCTRLQWKVPLSNSIQKTQVKHRGKVSLMLLTSHSKWTGGILYKPSNVTTTSKSSCYNVSVVNVKNVYCSKVTSSMSSNSSSLACNLTPQTWRKTSLLLLFLLAAISGKCLLKLTFCGDRHTRHQPGAAFETLPNIGQNMLLQSF